jgi:PAS domain S-box-containing protein
MNLKSEELLASTHKNLQFNTLKYKYAVENSNIGIWEWDIITNKVYHSNESKAIFGYENSEIDLTEIDWKKRIHPEDLGELIQVVENHIENNTKEYRSEHRILCKDGSYKWVLDCGKIVEFDILGNPIRFIGTTIDITQRKEDEESLIQSLSIITNQNKKLTNFAHIVTHNLKEHAGNFESLLGFYEEGENDDEKNEIITHLKVVSESLTKTISNLRQIVSRQLNRKIELKQLNFNYYVNKVCELLELEIIDKNALIINNVSDDLNLYSNEAYLESIILNLASNALKYSHPDRNPIICIDSVYTEDAIKIKLSDNGIGIDLKKYENDIFGLYNTFHGNDNAEGIGLYITKNQIETLGGKISVKSKVGIGTTFTITIKTKKAS